MSERVSQREREKIRGRSRETYLGGVVVVSAFKQFGAAFWSAVWLAVCFSHMTHGGHKSCMWRMANECANNSIKKNKRKRGVEIKT